MGLPVEAGGYAKVNLDNPAVKKAIDSTFQIAVHPYWDQNPKTHATESGNLVNLTDQQRANIGVSKNDEVIVTDSHGVEDVRGAIMLQASTGKWYSGTLVKLDDVTDLAFIKVNGLAKGVLPEVELAQEDHTQPGDLVFSTGHERQSETISVNGGTYEGLTTKALQTKRLDAIYQQLTPNNPSSYYQNYTSKINGLPNPRDRADALSDFNRTLLETHLNNQPGNSGGCLFNLDGKIIGVQEAVESQTDIGTLGHDGYIPVNQVISFANSPQKFAFLNKYAQYSINGSSPQQVPLITDIRRVNGDPRLPYNADDLLVHPERQQLLQNR
jgi:S1-C subfamily serine protease